MTHRQDNNPIRPLGDARPSWATAKGRPYYRECNQYLMPDGAVRWVAQGEQLPYVGTMTLSGRRAGYVLYWRVEEDGSLLMRRVCRYPFLADGCVGVYDDLPTLLLQGAPLAEQVSHVDRRGTLCIVSQAAGLRIERTYYPALHSVGLVEHIVVYNTTTEALSLRLDCSTLTMASKPTRGVVHGCTPADEGGRMLTDLEEDLTRQLAPEGMADYYLVYWARPEAEDLMVDCRLEWKKRAEQIEECFCSTVSVHTPEPLFDRAFAHAYLCGVECIADTVLGAMPYTRGVEVADVADVVPIMTLSGNYRAVEGWQNLLQLLSEQYNALGTVPAYYDRHGHALGHASLVTYALAVAQYALLGGRALAQQQMPVVERVAEHVMAHLSDGIYKIKGVDFVTQYRAYALLMQASRLADSVGKERNAKQWLDAARHMRTHLHSAHVRTVAGLQTYRVGGAKLCADVSEPLLYGLDECALDTAKALTGDTMFDGLAHIRREAGSKTCYDRDMLRAIRALYTVGFSDAATALARSYTEEMLLGLHAPYPLAQWTANPSHSPMDGWRYCQTLVQGWLGLSMRGVDSLQFTMHVPQGWGFLQVAGLHVAGNVLNLSWTDNHLAVSDIYGRVLYTGMALSGQHITIELP